jgi:hypothetical protein
MLSKFLKDLRNQMPHHQLPVAQSEQTFTSDSMSITFTLPYSLTLSGILVAAA